MFQPADSMSLGFFCIMALTLFIGLLFWAWKSKVDRLWIIGFIGLCLLGSLLALTGISPKHPIPTVPLFMLALFAFGISFSFSNSGKALVKATPLYLLVGFQSFRFPLELILHQWAQIGTIPETMTWTGSNIDILAGVIALIFAPFVKRSPTLGWVPQIIGTVLLLNVLRVVAMSSPFPFSWQVEPPLLLAMYFPYVLIGPIFVLPAFMGHLLTFRKLLTR